ncbi:uncharacterized protein LOC126805061 [Argentina anserina]|uniref:uncharacterized protein LOC126805061 n=1 Tax=Argentina anserina TaxID=57926 RepID=UPI002176425F|nr:uncharacterized protein LOC126805061 [Potentilla anserina]
MLKMVWLVFFQLMLLGFSGATHESDQVPTLSETTYQVVQVSSLPRAVAVSELSKVSRSVLMAETRLTNPTEAEPTTRKLLSTDPFPARPNPQPTTSDPPFHSSVGFSVPANSAKNPQTPQAQTASPAPAQTASPPNPEAASPPSEMSSPEAPDASPVYHQATPPFPYELPPCKPRAPAPEFRPVHKLWCVAKPSVPAETLQEAVDYACGAGGADCQEIMPDGNCYYPESVVAHASYAFNSYWQKNKRNGGTCSFGGTAMLINSDPSYQLCRFVVT